MQYLVDGTVHLTRICTAAAWHFKACVSGLEAAGLTHADALVFAAWAFGTDAVYKQSVGDESLTVEEYARLTITSSTPAEHSAGLPI